MSFGVALILFPVVLFSGSSGETAIPVPVQTARDFISSRAPTTQPICYEADYEYTWHCREVVEGAVDAPNAPGRLSDTVLRVEPLPAPVTSTGTIHVEVSGDNLTVSILPRQTAPEHLHLHQLRQPITIWRQGDMVGEIRHGEQSAFLDVGGTTRRPWPDQLFVPHVIFTAHLAEDWQRKFPVLLIQYKQLSQAFPVTTKVTTDGDEYVVSESFAKPGVLTRFGPYRLERITRYASVAGMLLPVEVMKIYSGVKDASVKMVWSPDTVHDAHRALMPELIRFQHFPMPQDRNAPPILGYEQTFRIKPETVRTGPNAAGNVTIPTGFSVVKRYPPRDPREPEEFIAGAEVAAAASASVDRRWLLLAGTVLVLILIIGSFGVAISKGSSKGSKS